MFLSKRQQSLDLSTTAGAFMGRNLVQTDRTSLWTIGGVVLTNEKYAAPVGTEAHARNVEALAGINLRHVSVQDARHKFQLSGVPQSDSTWARQNDDKLQSESAAR